MYPITLAHTFGVQPHTQAQPRSQGLRGETVTKTLVKFVLSFQNFGKKIACAVRHNRIQPLLQCGCVALRMRFFPQNFGTIKRILPGSSSPSHREGPGTEVDPGALCAYNTVIYREISQLSSER